MRTKPEYVRTGLKSMRTKPEYVRTGPGFMRSEVEYVGTLAQYTYFLVYLSIPKKKQASLRY